MWGSNSISCGFCSNRQCMCHTSRVPYLCMNSINQYFHDNALLSSTSFQNYPNPPENAIYGFAHASNTVNPLFHTDNDHESGEQIETNETGSWLLPNPNTNQTGGSLNLPSYCSWTGNQDQSKFDHMQNQGIQVNYNEDYGQSSREGMVEKQEQQSMFSQGIQNDHPTFASSFYETGEQITTNETNTLLPNPYINQINGSLNLTSYCPLTGNQDHGLVDHNANYVRFSREGLEEQQEHILKLSQGIQSDYSTFPSLFYVRFST
ncbi:uncharacterized protein LOC110871519 [Helianthus annuus]|uniref:uncharacterized protein LOC110871519 n=1 Tax=Helianthus annuus TaxID=4232 RepID=UPI0016531E76|nr:uncharacterized protein LOC110871519 [Helianthus annuus]